MKKVPTLILFKRVRMDNKGGMTIKIRRTERTKKKEVKKVEVKKEKLPCDQCDFMAKTNAGLAVHKRLTHNKKKNENNSPVPNVQPVENTGEVNTPQSS
ncbi:MAG: hypothetical protein WC269_06315 [Candidatus Gracilibacteria bacterium]|jgi:hypothetical protein